MTTTNPIRTSSTPEDKKRLSVQIFTTFLNDGQLCLSHEDLYAYAEAELNVDLSKLPQLVKENLPIILVGFMNLWPGWRYKSEYKSKELFFLRFQKYMDHKIKSLAGLDVQSIEKELESVDNGSDNSNKSSASNDLKKNTNLDYAPYAISIKCPPQLLNTIIFSSSGDDVIMKQHVAASWQSLSMIQLMNWPYIQVSFRTPEICFVRRQATEYLRYINFLPDQFKVSMDDSVIEHVEIVGDSKLRRCYSYQYLREYSIQYLAALKQVRYESKEKIQEIHIILQQFLQDIKHINVNDSMATNTSVLFKLSPTPFIRNKKLVQKDSSEEARVSYCEIITPKVELVLSDFRALTKNQKNKNSPVKFLLPYKIIEQAADYLPHISYTCTFCHIMFEAGDTKKKIVEHLIKVHKTEQHVRCYACKTQFNVLELAACRWRHKCSRTQATDTVSID